MLRRIPLLIAAALVLAAVPASAAILNYHCNLSGPAEAPPNLSPGIGGAEVTIDDVANTMRVRATFSGLLGNTSACHIHCPTAVAGTGTAGVATMTPAFTGFPLGVTAGSMDHTFDLTALATYNGPFVTANGGTAASAEAAFLAALVAGKAYFNIHTTTVPGGEIRGFLNAFDPVPTVQSTWGRVKALYH
jgi:CHRD domain-containing protein